jgi:prolyl-tRNA synthetase
MRISELKIHTLRDAPNNARTEGFAYLVRAGYISREGLWLPLGNQSLDRLRKLADPAAFIHGLSLPFLEERGDAYIPLDNGPVHLIHCEKCGYTARKEIAQYRKTPFSTEAPLPLEKVSTPDCHTIEALASFLTLPREKTAKALMFSRLSDGRFVFVVIRGDMTLSEEKLRTQIGEFRVATTEEILSAGATPGFASPIGLRNSLILADDLIPQSPNLVGGANEDGFHLLQMNCGRDYTPDAIVDLIQAKAGDMCLHCENPLKEMKAFHILDDGVFHPDNLILALSEIYHDEKGLTLPPKASPFDVYLMHIPGRDRDTSMDAANIHDVLEHAGITTLFDDRNERAGVKFNDADLIGCPLRMTIAEKHIREGMVVLKPRREKEFKLIQQGKVVEEIQSLLNP